MKTQNVQLAANLLKFTFAIVPVVAGIDKFSNLLTNWEAYVSPSIAAMLPFSAAAFMMIVGVVEIIAGLLVFLKPSVGGLIVAAWLVLIAINLLLSGSYFDVAVRDLVMAVAAFSMAKLAEK